MVKNKTATRIAVLTFGLGLGFSPLRARELSLDQRIAAQTAIERVYYAHQLGTTQPFEQAVSPEIIEYRVRDYLKQSAALDELWHTPVTAEMLEREIERMARDTRMPERLQELFAAVGYDGFTIQECLARRVLVDRLSRSFVAQSASIQSPARSEAENLRAAVIGGSIDPAADHPRRSVRELMRSDASTEGISPLVEGNDAFEFQVLVAEHGDRLTLATFSVPKTSWNEWWATRRDSQDELGVPAVAAEALQLPPIGHGARPFGVPCMPDDTWENLGTLISPEGRFSSTAVWTGSMMVIWGGHGDSYHVLKSGARYDPATDSWIATSSVNAPWPRWNHTAVWTGNRMIVWGGRDNDDTALSSGGIYDPVADTWTPTPFLNAPAARWDHSAVWTGDVMIIWGGSKGFGTGWENTGARYSPATGLWTATSTSGAPSPRSEHSAIWTGSRMVVWGGRVGVNSLLNTGGRYDPATDTWTLTSTTGAPSARMLHTAIWTGSRMVVWGGWGGGNSLNTGGRYDPATDTWTPTSTSRAPAGRTSHTAVWTGNRMIVWGGGGYLNSGGLYDPLVDSWTPTSLVGAPSARREHEAVWTGSLMVVFGGDGETGLASGGARYDPTANSWTSMSFVHAAPTPRAWHTVVWTGSEMIVWGGQADDNVLLFTGGRYDPATDSWTATAISNALVGRWDHTAVWTGTQMAVWGGHGPTPQNTGGLYSPLTDTWTTISTVNAPSAREGHTAVWTGSKMIVWGSKDPVTTGGRYDPATNSWTPTSQFNPPSARSDHTAVWTGSKMIVWGGWNGSSSLNSGALYDPQANVWTPISVAGAPSPRNDHSAVWTGSKMIVWGGSSNVNTGGLYDPSTDTWHPTSTSGAPAARSLHTAVWTGTQMVVWGGDGAGGPLGTGGRYDPTTDGWTPMSTTGAPPPRYLHSAVWTGTSVAVWGGVSNQVGFPPYGDGGRYALGYHIDDDGDGFAECDGDCNDSLLAVFPGAPELCDQMSNDCSSPSWPAVPSNEITDADGDGFVACGDCNEANATVFPAAAQLCDGVNNDCSDPSWPTVPANETGSDGDGDGWLQCVPWSGGGSDCDPSDANTYPGAPEVNDGLDNQCEDDIGKGVIDEVSGTTGFLADKTTFGWLAQSGATLYEVARSPHPDFHADCVQATMTGTSWVDTESPSSGAVFFYLVRAVAPHPGSWGQDSEGHERTGVCPP